MEKPKVGIWLRFLSLAVTIGPSILAYKLILEAHPRPLVEDEYWGSVVNKGNDTRDEDQTIYPFKINVTEDILNDLKIRLERELESQRLLPPLEDAGGFEYGFNSKYLKTVGEYWLKKYDWREREKLLNKYPHFKTKIGGLDVHFQHVKPVRVKGGVDPRPLLILHGWPGSFVEFQKIIPLLAEPKNSKYNYELVIPSLPGYAWSEAPKRKGMSPTEMANIFKRLMKRLGHEKFFIMGGDWGAFITSDMATVYPENVIAAQSHLCVVPTIESQLRYAVATFLPQIFMDGQERGKVLPLFEQAMFILREFGYFLIQMTKPDTIGTTLTHSPLGLASYILEKFSSWTNKSWITREDGGISEKFTMDELLDNIMVYWVTRSITSSQRVYKEQMNFHKKHQLDRVPTNVPYSCHFLSQEIVVMPKFALTPKYRNLTHFLISDRGGHFGAFEEPVVVADNAIPFFDKFR